MAWAAIAMGGAIAVAIALLLWSSARRGWNVDGADDRRRDAGDQRRSTGPAARAAAPPPDTRQGLEEE